MATTRPVVDDWGYDGLFVSQPHYRLPKGGWSGGGPFYMWSRNCKSTNRKDVSVLRAGVDKGTYTCLGVLGIAGATTAPTVPPAVPTWDSVKSDLSGHYATGWARARPGNPQASVGQFIAELRDLPSIPLKGAFKGKPFFVFGKGFKTPVPFQDIPRTLYAYLKNFRNLGSEYLNVVFGWKPFVGDIRKMIDLYGTIDKRIAQIHRENGKNIRRRSTVEDSSTSTQTQQLYNYAYANVIGGPGEITNPSQTTLYKVTTTTKTRIWFVGSFRYFMFEPPSSPVGQLKMRAALYGALPTPELLWEVLPWSWLIDWFSNVGDIMSNASPNAVDNLTSRYSFIMKHVTTETEASAHVHHEGRDDPFNKWMSVDNTFKTTSLVVSKSRQGGGNPFGLNVQLPSLSAYQLGILAALGLSRSSVR
jgi:hypothetical protein